MQLEPTLSYFHMHLSLCVCGREAGLLRLHEADGAAIDWLTTYGS